MSGNVETLLERLALLEAPSWHDDQVWFSEIFPPRRADRYRAVVRQGRIVVRHFGRYSLHLHTK